MPWKLSLGMSDVAPTQSDARSLEDDFQPGLEIRLPGLPMKTHVRQIAFFQPKRLAAVLRLPEPSQRRSDHRHRGIRLQLQPDLVLRAGLNGNVALTDPSARLPRPGPDPLGLLARINFRVSSTKKTGGFPMPYQWAARPWAIPFPPALCAIRFLLALRREAAVGEHLGIQTLPHRVARILEVETKQQWRNDRSPLADVQNDRRQGRFGVVSLDRAVARPKPENRCQQELRRTPNSTTLTHGNSSLAIVTYQAVGATTAPRRRFWFLKRRSRAPGDHADQAGHRVPAGCREIAGTPTCICYNLQGVCTAMASQYLGRRPCSAFDSSRSHRPRT